MVFAVEKPKHFHLMATRARLVITFIICLLQLFKSNIYGTPERKTTHTEGGREREGEMKRELEQDNSYNFEELP